MFDLSKKTDEQKVKFIFDNHADMEARRKIHDDLKRTIGELFDPRGFLLLHHETDKHQRNNGAVIYTPHPENVKNKFVRGITGYMISRQPWWLRFTAARQTLMKNDEVKKYYQRAEDQIKFEFNQSTFYKHVPNCIEDGVTVGPGVLLPEEDTIRDRIIFKPKSHWRVWLADDEFGNVAAYHEKVCMTAIQMLLKFGEEKLPQTVINQAKGIGQKNPFTDHNLLYVVYRNPNHKPDSLKTLDKAWIGYFVMEKSRGIAGKGKLIEEKGRDWGPIVLRMSNKEGLVYNTNRTLAAQALTEALIDNKMGEKELKAVHLAVEPPIWAPKTLKSQINSSLKPGGRILYNDANTEEVKTLLDRLNWPISDAQRDKLATSMDDKFFVRFFELLSAENMQQITATQASFMQGEKAILMWEIIESIQDDILEPAANLMWKVAESHGRMPEPPPILLADEESRKVINEFDGPLSQLRRNLIGMKGTVSSLAIMREIIRIFPDSARTVKDTEVLEDVTVAAGGRQSWFLSDAEKKAQNEAIAQAQAEEQAKDDLERAAAAVPNVSGSVEPDSILAGVS